MDTISWPQDEIGLVKPSLITSTPSSSSTPCTTTRQVVERKVRPLKERALNCPRCNSTNTKFCYYNNYSLTQPRYFCKTCRRYWTEGGSLRNVPVGGGSRKNKKQHSSSNTIATPQASSRDTHRNPNLTSSQQEGFYGVIANSSAVGTSTWSAGVDLMMRSPFAQVPMVQSGVSASDQGLRSAADLGLDQGCYGYMQGVMLPFQDMGKIPTSDRMMEMNYRGGVGRDGLNDHSASNGVWNL